MYIHNLTFKRSGTSEFEVHKNNTVEPIGSLQYGIGAKEETTMHKLPKQSNPTQSNNK